MQTKKKDKEDIIEQLKQNIDNNYERIKPLLDSEYSSQFELLKEEICFCLICGLNQASITLTNHFFENFFKTIVQLKMVKDNNSEIELDDKYTKAVEDYDDKNLELIINKACSLSLITKEEKKTLKELKNKYRNPYSHSEKKKIFGEDELTGFSLNSNGEFKVKEFKTSDNLPVQNLMQSLKAKDDAINYFSKLNEIVLNTLNKFYE